MKAEEDDMLNTDPVLTCAEEGGFVAHDPQTGTFSQGKTIEEAIANLREAVDLFLEENLNGAA